MNSATWALGIWISTAITVSAAEIHADRYWPQWRGPRASGVAPHADPPVEWAEDKNVRWKVQLAGEGSNTPIIWGDLVFVQTAFKTDRTAAAGPAEEKDTAAPQTSDAAEPGPDRRARENGPRGERGADGSRDEPRREGRRGGGRRGQEKPTHYYQWHVHALDRKTGREAWKRQVREEVPHEACHPDGSMAANSAVTDGERLFAYFGSRGVYALDLRGNPLWEKDLGDMSTRNSFGEGGSPALFGDVLVINWDHEGDSFIVALDKRTGDELWRKSRDEPTSWATPLVIEHDGRAQVITSATNRIRAYDLKTGELIWECGGLTLNVIPSPVAGFDLVYALSGFRGNALKAISYGRAKGDITGSGQVAWSYDKDTPYVPSPLLYEESLYFLDHNRGILTCLDARNGKPFYEKQRLEDVQGVYASPVGAAGRVYIAGRDGKVLVLQRGDEFKLLATNTLDDGFDASPAAVDGELYLRGHKALYCIARN